MITKAERQKLLQEYYREYRRHHPHIYDEKYISDPRNVNLNTGIVNVERIEKQIMYDELFGIKEGDNG